MMPRPLLILPAFLLVALLLTIGYAILGLGGPEVALRRAREAMDKGDRVSALRLLDRALGDIDRNQLQLMEHALRMRATIYGDLGDPERAIADLTVLIERLRIGGEELTHDRIRMLNELGRQRADVKVLDQALTHCQEWLAGHPDDRETMAFAGTNRQSVLELEFDAWRGEFDQQVPVPARPEVSLLLDRAIYGMFDEARVVAVIAALDARLGPLIPGFAATSAARVRALRQRAADARGWFLLSLSGPRSNAIAYRGVAAQLLRARDDDTLLMLAHTHCQRVAPPLRIEPAIDIAEVHIRHERYRAAVEIAARVLPGEQMPARLRAGTLPAESIHLLVLQAIAVRALGQEDKAAQLHAHLEAIIQCDPKPTDVLGWQPVLIHAANGLLLSEKHARQGALLNLRIAAGTGHRITWNRKLVLNHVFKRLLAIGEPESRPDTCAQWSQIDSASPFPAHELARYALADGKPAQAHAALSRALADLPEKDRSLQLLAEVERAMARVDVDKAITHTLDLQLGVPDEIRPYPALSVLFAQRALQLGQIGIAAACVKRAREAFPRTRLPRHLETELLLRTGKLADAESVAQLLLHEDPEDQRAIALLAEVRTAMGRGVDDLRFATLLNGEPSLDSMRFLAGKWLERREYSRVIEVAERATTIFGVDLEIQVLATRALMVDPLRDRKKLFAVLQAVFHLSRGAGAEDVRRARLGRWALGQYVLLNPQNANQAARSAMLERFLADNDSAAELAELAANLAARGEHELALRAFRDLTELDRYESERKGAHFLAAAESALYLGDVARARTLFVAGLAFADGKPAAIGLAVLDLASTGRCDVPPGLVVDAVATACVAAQTDPAAARAFIDRRIAANPQNLPCRLIRAILDPKAESSEFVAGLDPAHNTKLLALVALLDKPSCGTLATEIAAEIAAKHPDNPVAQILHAKALMRANRGTDAHIALTRAGSAPLKDPLLMAAALDVLVGTESQFLRGTKVMEQMLSLVLQGGDDIPAAVKAIVVRHNSVVLEVPGLREKILPLVAKFWIAHPDVAGAGLPEARILVDAGQLQDALTLLPALEQGIPAAQRSDYLELYYQAATQFCAANHPDVSKPFVAAALERLEGGEVHGATLHFVFGVCDRAIAAGGAGAAPAAQLAADVAAKYLKPHVDAFFEGIDPSIANLLATLERQATAVGHIEALRQLDVVLHRDPSLLEVWRLRARWLVVLDRFEDAAQSLLWIPRYLYSPDTLDLLIQLLARAGTLVEKGEGLLANRGLARASGFSLGLVQLRVGTYWPAAQAMERATPQPDGAHLYFRAMALLALHSPAAIDIARTLLVQFAEQYPSSTFRPSAETVLAVL